MSSTVSSLIYQAQKLSKVQPILPHSSYQSFFGRIQNLEVIMGIFAYDFETTSIITPDRLFKAYAVDGDNLMPKVAPLAVESSKIIEGNGGPGTIKMITFSKV